MGEAAKQNPSKKVEQTAGFIKAPKMPYFDEDKDFMDSYLNRFEKFLDAIIGLKSQIRQISQSLKRQIRPPGR